QRDYKRLLAYSSIEHMGLTVFAFGLGAPGMIAGVMHLTGHALAKSMLFFASGNILNYYRSTLLARVGGVVRRLPYSGTFFLIGIAALLAVPPSPLFFSEYLIITTAVMSHPWYLAGISVALAVILAGMLQLLIPVLLKNTADTRGEREPEALTLSHAAMLLHVVVLFGMGVFFLMPQGYEFIRSIVQSI
ncbi:MAG: proton-conducting transporter membrane subunit, partial [Patescibacteria group bacterium]